jgi:hypothetical protein
MLTAASCGGEEYCYDLWSTDFFGQSRYHGRVCVAVPHSVISFAQVEPNPFSDQTTLRYVLEDRVLLSIKVYDLKGKEVQTLMERREMPRRQLYAGVANHRAYASQGALRYCADCLSGGRSDGGALAGGGQSTACAVRGCPAGCG